MANQLRPNLGLNLQSIVAGDQPPLNIPQQPNLPPMTPAIPQQGGGFFGQQGMGRYLAGAIGDALLQNAGMQPVFAPAQRDQRRAQLEDVQWSRRQQQERADKQWEWQNKPREPSAMERNLSVWQSWTPEQKAAYQDFNKGDPFVTTSLPNGQFYAGPQSGLIGALTGGAAAATAPKVGDVVPDPRKAGGGAGNGVGGFLPR